MIMANGSSSFQWQFDTDDDLIFDLTAIDDEPLDFESLFNTIGDKSHDDYSKNVLAVPSSSTAPCLEATSHGLLENIETQNGSLSFPLLNDSEASTSRAFYSCNSSVTERQTFISSFENMEYQQDVFPMHFTGSINDWSMPNNQDLSSSNNHGTIGTSLERVNINNTFGFINGSNSIHQLMDKTGIIDGIFDGSVRNSYQTLDVLDNVEPSFRDFSGYSDILRDPNTEFSLPSITSINDPFYSGSSSLNYNNDMLFNVKTESEEHLMRKLLRNSTLNYETVAEGPGGVAVENLISDSGPYVSSEGSKTFIQSASGFHGLRKCNMPHNIQTVCVKNDSGDTPVPVQSTACKKKSPADGKSLRAHPKNMCIKLKLKTIDEHSGNQVPSQNFPLPHQKSNIPLPADGLAVPLLRHQRIALSWMSKKETKNTHCCGGILADDQGLGKTISAIALILKERSPQSTNLSASETKETKPETLYLDDDENMNNDEHTNTSFQTKTSLAAGTLVVCPTSVLRQWNDELQNKVITEANLSVLVYYGVNRTKDPLELAKYDVVITTYAIVSMEVPKQPLDEDDVETKIKISPTKKRKYPPVSDESPKKEPCDSTLGKLRWFRVILDEAQSIKNYKTQVAKACWGLRAKRRWCLSGTPIQNSIDDLYSYFRFLRYYPFSTFKIFCSKIKAPIQRNPVSGYKRLQVILKTIMLRRTKGTLLKGEPIISLPPKTIILEKVDFTAEERGFYQCLEAESRAQFAEYAAAGTVKQNYVNILLMLLRLRQACDHPSLVKDSSSTTDWKLSVEKAKEFSQEKINRILNCLEASLAICSICNDPPEDAVVTTCEHVFCNQCILEHLSTNDSQCPYAECKQLLSKYSIFCKSTLKVSISGEVPSSGLVESNRPVDSLKTEAFKALESSKIKATLQVLRSISKPQNITVKNNNSKENSVVREKAIVFSQWTRMLDLVEVCLKDSSIGYRRLDGTMSVGARDKAVKDFNTLPEVTVIIMSLKAASLGLNMVAACHVILLDIWWNPTMEDQAIDRAHRIGQTRPVTVFRFTVKDTVEDRILALQKKKREMVASAFGEDKNGGSQTRLTVDDMKYLFQA